MPPSPNRQIVVLGGGGFSMEPRNPRLDLYILNLTRKRTPRVCFVPTASGDSPDYVARFHKAFAKHRCRPSHLPLFRRDATDPAAHLLAQDVIYVGGGNTANLLAVWRTHGVDRAMRQAWRRGTILCGVSAGMICWFECSVTDSFGPLAPLHDGLGLLPGSACPHYDGEADRRPTYHQLIAAGFPPGIPTESLALAARSCWLSVRASSMHRRSMSWSTIAFADSRSRAGIGYILWVA